MTTRVVPDEEGESVRVYLYDLSMGMARQFSGQFLGKQIDGIWHTAVVVFGREWFFGGGGIYDLEPGQTPYGTPVQTIDMGITSIPRELFIEMLADLRPRYNMTSYDLIKNNCNNFTNDVVTFLTGRPIPPFITGLPEEVLSTPMGAMFRPMVEQMQNRMRDVMPSEMSSLGPQATPDVSSMLGALNGMGGSAPAMPFGGGGAPETTIPVTAHHKHDRVSLAHLRHNQPVVLNIGAENAPKIVSKLLEFADLQGVAISTEEKAMLEILQAKLKDRKEDIASITLPKLHETCALLDRLAAALPVERLLPVLDLLRLCVLIPSVNSHYAAQQALVQQLFTQYVTDRSTDVPRGVLLMVYRLAANMFAHKAGADALVSPSLLQATTDVISDSVLSTDEACRLAGSTLAYNYSLHLPTGSSDQVTQAASALVHALGQPQRAGEECDYRMLMALGHFLFKNDDACELVGMLGLDLAPFRQSSSSKIAAVAREVTSLLS